MELLIIMCNMELVVSDSMCNVILYITYRQESHEDIRSHSWESPLSSCSSGVWTWAPQALCQVWCRGV